MAIRKSGNVTVRLSYDDRSGEYVCRVTSSDGHRGYESRVRPPATLTRAVDAPAAYDDAAAAAIAFVVDELTRNSKNFGGRSDNLDPDYTDSGIAIRRK